MPYLEVVISRKGLLHPEPAKLDTVMNWPSLNNKAELACEISRVLE